MNHIFTLGWEGSNADGFTRSELCCGPMLPSVKMNMSRQNAKTSAQVIYPNRDMSNHPNIKFSIFKYLPFIPQKNPIRVLGGGHTLMLNELL